MKIGILTYHSQLNYGALLQCYALRSALQWLGHSVRIVDRWIDPWNNNLLGAFKQSFFRCIPMWVKLVVRTVLGSRELRHTVRTARTIRFVRSLGLTREHFYKWSDLSANDAVDLKRAIDCAVVGSDQVWHGSLKGETTLPFLMKDAPAIPAISYAASIGEKKLQEDIDYLNGFKKFKAISVREKEAVDLVKSSGYAGDVAHVVDPTMLVEPAFWHDITKNCKARSNRVVCYFLSEPVDEALALIQPWAKANRLKVTILCGNAVRKFNWAPSAIAKSLMRILRDIVKYPNVRIHDSAGPLEFVKDFACASACITDSFHAVMFSSIFNLNCRFLRPTSAFRQVMFSRIEEFAATSVKGHFIVDDIPAAMTSLVSENRMTYNFDAIAKRRAYSLEWLKKALAKVEKEVSQ